MRKEGCITEFGILTDVDECLESLPLEDFILIESASYLEYILFDNDDIINKLVKDLTKDKTKLDIFLDGILVMKNSDLVLSCIKKIQGLNEEARNYVSRLQKKNMLDKILNKDDKTLAKIAIKELLKLSILQEKESTTLEFPQISSVEHCNGR
ncbi:hypothetical protein [Wolbachia endosymbiont of Bemisia tabaci]|uniref:hypothetical protein n=1 Tax=Wolbachia endosymbiont of Bemisia tabaci TaxID=215173 RepID=UPI001FECE115|nr:hypothetical protein [Wolbachia endosymbiont of Bemisia tabaci]